MLHLSSSKSCYLYLPGIPHSPHLSPPSLPLPWAIEVASHLISLLLFLFTDPRRFAIQQPERFSGNMGTSTLKKLSLGHVLEMLWFVIEENWEQAVNGEIHCGIFLWQNTMQEGKSEGVPYGRYRKILKTHCFEK